MHRLAKQIDTVKGFSTPQQKKFGLSSVSTPGNQDIPVPYSSEFSSIHG